MERSGLAPKAPWCDGGGTPTMHFRRTRGNRVQQWCMDDEGGYWRDLDYSTDNSPPRLRYPRKTSKPRRGLQKPPAHP